MEISGSMDLPSGTYLLPMAGRYEQFEIFYEKKLQHHFITLLKKIKNWLVGRVLSKAKKNAFYDSKSANLFVFLDVPLHLSAKSTNNWKVTLQFDSQLSWKQPLKTFIFF